MPLLRVISVRVSKLVVRLLRGQVPNNMVRLGDGRGQGSRLQGSGSRFFGAEGIFFYIATYCYYGSIIQIVRLREHELGFTSYVVVVVIQCRPTVEECEDTAMK